MWTHFFLACHQRNLHGIFTEDISILFILGTRCIFYDFCSTWIHLPPLHRQTSKKISSQYPTIVLARKNGTCHKVDFAVLLDYGVKMKESKNIDKYLALTTERKKLRKHEKGGDTNYIWNKKRLGKFQWHINPCGLFNVKSFFYRSNFYSH